MEFETNLNAAAWNTWEIPGCKSDLYPSYPSTSSPRKAGRYSYRMMFCRVAMLSLLAAWII